MRIVRLDLRAFGPFTDRSLHFGDKPGLHIVHGPNEAGKSSSLRALRCLLYGIPARTNDNFVHAYPSLRIGGVVEAADGTRLEFIRRKGNAKTLRAADDNKVFDEARLLRLLNGIDETEFGQRFGIDYEELRSGGEALVCGGGGLAETLFGAGAGVADFRAIQQQLRAEADDRFKPSGARPKVNALIAQFKEAQNTIREAQLPTSQWCHHDEERRAAEQRLAQLKEDLAAKRAELSRLKRVSESLPLIGQRTRLREQLEELSGVALLPENFSVDRSKAQSELEHARRAQEAARVEIAKLEEELSGLEIPEDLLANRTAIEQLHTQLGSYQKAAADRPERVAERDALRKQVRDLLEKLGRPPELEEAEKLKLPMGQRKRIRELAAKYGRLFDRQAQGERSLEELADAIRQVQENLQQLPQLRDIAELQRAIRQVQRHGDLDEKRSEAAAFLDDRRKQAEVDLARLQQFDGTLDELEKLPVPSAETIERFDREFAAVETAISRAQEKCDELVAERQELQGKLDALRLEGDVPSETELEQARHRRDQGWQLVQQALGGAASPPDEAVTEFIAEFDPSGDLAAAFAASMAKADAIADRLRREAGRVAQQAELTARLQQVEEKLQQARATFDEAARRQSEVQEQWNAQWQPAGIEPLTPGEMAAWLSSQQQLVKLAGDLRRDQAELDRVVDEISGHKARLNECLAALDQPLLPEGDPLSAALDCAEEVAASIGESNQQREKLAHEHKRLLNEHPKAEREAEAARAELEQWRASWEEAVAALGLDGRAEPSEADDVMEVVDEIFRLLHDADKLDERIRGMDDDAAKFKQSVKHLLEQVASELVETMQRSVEMAVSHLVDRKSQADKDQTKADGWQKQLKKHQADLREAEQNLARWQAKLDQLCQQAGCSAPDELPQAEERSKQRRDIQRELHILEQRLLDLAAGTPLNAWIADVEACDCDEVKAELDGLDDAIGQLEEDKEAAAKQFGQHQQKLEEMDGSAKAAEAQVQAEHLLANIRSEAEEYIRLRLASELLARAMERFREANQGPVLNRASELFVKLTRGSFVALRPDYDDSGDARLVGVRSDGGTVTTDGMSDGTCDQLYLALRVALLESSLVGREPLPFIVDDILIMFDDNRAAAALEVFAELAEKTQVIFFTHHQHLVEIAQDAIPADRLAIHELCPAGVLPEAETASA